MVDVLKKWYDEPDLPAAVPEINIFPIVERGNERFNWRRSLKTGSLLVGTALGTMGLLTLSHIALGVSNEYTIPYFQTNWPLFSALLGTATVAVSLYSGFIPENSEN